MTPEQTIIRIHREWLAERRLVEEFLRTLRPDLDPDRLLARASELLQLLHAKQRELKAASRA